MSQFDLFKRCPKCDHKMTDFNWCHKCNAERFKKNFKNWKSGNEDIDEFIQKAQLSAKGHVEVIEWMPYERFRDIEFLAKGGFGSVYKAKWKDGWIREWNDKKNDWERNRPNEFVALKSLNNSEDIELKFIEEITCHRNLDSAFIIKLFGITQDPETKDYMMVLEYAEGGSLSSYLRNQNHKKLSWENKIKLLYNIAIGLSLIHKNFVHRDLHSGNILIHDDREDSTCITDMGLCRPVRDDHKDAKNSIYGATQYLAPEVLRGENYTKASDIYSFGMIMYEVISEKPPYHDVNISDDFLLSIEIGKGLRPKFHIVVPQLLLDLFEKCTDENHLNRPKAEQLQHTLLGMCNDAENKANNRSELLKQIRKANKSNRKSTNNVSSNASDNSSNNSFNAHSNSTHSRRIPISSNSCNSNNNFDNYDDTEDMQI